jgi:hypothetical protein
MVSRAGSGRSATGWVFGVGRFAVGVGAVAVGVGAVAVGVGNMAGCARGSCKGAAVGYIGIPSGVTTS